MAKIVFWKRPRKQSLWNHINIWLIIGASHAWMTSLKHYWNDRLFSTPIFKKNTHPPTPEIFNESTNVRKTLIEDVMSFLVLIFFSSKILKFVHSQFWFFAAWLVISFKVECISVVKGRQMPLSPSKSVEVAQNLIDPISEKRNLTFRFPSGTKTFTFWSNFFKLN